MIFLRIYIEFTSSLLWKRKGKRISFCAKTPELLFSFQLGSLASLGNRGGGGRRKSGACGQRRRGGAGGGARGRREGPVDGLGRGWGGRFRGSPRSRAPAAAVDGGGGGPVAGDGGERVEEHQ